MTVTSSRAHLLDTDWVIDFLAGDAAALALVRALAGGEIAISVITYMEVYEGIERSATPLQDEQVFSSFLVGVTVLPITRDIARQAARVRAALRRGGRSIRPRALDILIAATAMRHGMTLASHNAADYRDIVGLQLL